MTQRLLIFLLLGSMAAFAGTICPISTNPIPFAHNPDAAATGCNTVITISANLTVTTTVADSSPYDGSEDTLVGVVNNSTTSITSLILSGSDIFGLDGDGICTYTFVGSGYCTASQTAGTDPQDYYGPTSTFTISNANNGTVNFAPAIAAGGSTYFSLEEPPTASLNVIVGSAPEPGSIILMGFGISGLALALRRRHLKKLS